MVSVVECNALLTHAWAHSADYQEVTVGLFFFSCYYSNEVGWGGGGSEEAGLVLHGNIICGQKGRVVLKFSPAGVSIGNQ